MIPFFVANILFAIPIFSAPLYEKIEDPEISECITTNALSSYPKEIADLIFSKTKDFPNQTQLSIAIVQNNQTTCYGIVKENDSVKPADNHEKVFEIGSITKVFTSTVLASLVTEKKIKLSDSINSYYPFTFKENRKITFLTLANHTSGLPRLPGNLDLSDASNPYKNYTEKELEAYLKTIMTLENEPSETYSYSNLGAGLLGYTLGLSQGTSFEELVQKRVFDRYGMTNSFTGSGDIGDRLVKGLNANGKNTPNWDFDVLSGAGGVLSTTADLTQFAIAQFNPENRELALTRVPTFEASEKMEIGLGWHILQSENEQELFWHNGGTGGYSSSMAVNVADKVAVIILSNVSAFHPASGNIDQLCFELISHTGQCSF
ncbi:MAG: beta-lactamase family protein [Proteiniphilum sp.]|nr:beta-lactamase family protein [Proteiniphilum sp.]